MTAASTSARKRPTETRRKVFAHYGQLCVCCGTGRDLSIDHIDGNGKEHRKVIGSSLYAWLVQNNYPDGFQVLCRPCNSSKQTGEQCRIHGNMLAYEIGHRAWWHMQVENSRGHALGEILGYRLQKAQRSKITLALIRSVIGNHPRYNDSLARNDVQDMTATESAMVSAMTASDMINRWAPVQPAMH